MPAIEAAAGRKRPFKYDHAILVRCPTVLSRAMAQAAGLSMTSVSGYVRGAVLERLRRDGINPFRPGQPERPDARRRHADATAA
jgi:hypothetical protein